jgi:hypothetical protein
MVLNRLQDEFCCSNVCRDGRDSAHRLPPRLALPSEPRIVPERSRPVFFPRPLAPRTRSNPSPCGGFLPKWCWCWWAWGQKPRSPHHSQARSLRWGCQCRGVIFACLFNNIKCLPTIAFLRPASESSASGRSIPTRRRSRKVG